KNVQDISQTPMTPVSHKITFNPLPTDDKKELIGETKTGAKVFSHTDSHSSKHNLATSYLCGHVFRIGSEMKTEGIKYSGFIHISKKAKEEQYFDVLGTGIKGYTDNLQPKNPVSIMITGFTKFNGTPDNPTSRFLFNDGTSESYGLKNADPVKIDKMMKDKFGDPIKAPEPIIHKDKDGKKTEIGRSYTYKDPKTNEQRTINLTFVRLPVDDNLKNTDNISQVLDKGLPTQSTITNYPGDNTGKTLKDAIREVKPDALISFGAGDYPEDNYRVETISYGMSAEEDASYATKDDYIKNNDLADIYRQQLKK
ncbi:MAG: hypothetical protein H7263_03980, partial [Candidatus Sericytochromatia bacterium]|nr:hypothetical protein [Candidatus Sericytochromatia bacterium]